MPQTPASWRYVFLSYPCPTCGARVGEWCKTRSGNVYREVHTARGREGDRCPRCGILNPQGHPPRALCPKCNLLRTLEIERATKWRRETP